MSFNRLDTALNHLQLASLGVYFYKGRTDIELFAVLIKRSGGYFYRAIKSNFI